MDVINEAIPIAKVTLGQMDEMIVSEEIKINLKKGLHHIVG
jgi:hypothetical protein